MGELDIIKTKIQFLFPSLPKGEKVAAEYLVEKLEYLGEMDLVAISEETGVSQATVIRLCKRIGYSGFLEMKKKIRSAKYDPGQISQTEDAENTRVVMETIIEQNIEIMRKAYALVSDGYEEAAEALVGARNIHMFGNGDAIIPCELFNIKLLKIGMPCIVVNDQDLQLFSASSMREGDVAVAVSYTGRTKSVVEAMKKAKERGAVTIGITGTAKSPLIKYCDIVLNTGYIEDYSGGDIIARRIAEQTILETLYLKIMSGIEESVKNRKMEGAENINIYKIDVTEE